METEFLDHPLFKAVLDEPHLDEPRLIFADWLDECGDPRGDFIRLQVKLANMPNTHRLWLKYKATERELLRQHRSNWNRPLHQLLAKGPLCNQVNTRRGDIRGWNFHRGFVEELTVDARVFMQHSEELFQLGPICHLRPVNLFPVTNDIAGCESLNRIHALELQLKRQSRQERAIRELVQSPHLSNLKVLDVSRCKIGQNTANAIAESGSLENLKEVRAFGNAITATGALRLHERFGKAVRFSEFDDIHDGLLKEFKRIGGHQYQRLAQEPSLESLYGVARKRRAEQERLIEDMRELLVRQGGLIGRASTWN